jgi:glycosyltransferase involved in cell wall biosynthesis
MRILHTNMLRGWGGQSNRILTEATGSHRAGMTVAICAPTMAPLLDRAEALGIEVWRGYQFKPPFQLWYSLPDLRRLVAAIRAWKPDVIHAHGSQDTWLVVFAKQVLGRACPPVIRSRHNTVAWKTHPANLWLYGRIDAYIGISGACTRQLQGYPGIGEKPKTTIFSVPNLERFNGRQPTTVREELGIAPDAFVWGINARLRPEKAHDILIPAFARVHARHPNAVLLVSGDGSERGRIETMARGLGLGETVVRFLGFRKDAPAVLSAMDAYVHPSREEGLGTAILEALAVGLPVVGTHVGGIPESVRHMETGLICRAEDVDDLAAAMLRMMEDDELRARLAAAASPFVRETFSEETLVRRTNAFYEHVRATCRRR